MSDHKHTPGPWTYSAPEEAPLEFIIHTDGFFGWHLAHIETGAVKEEQVEANARMMAAAPALLSALEHARATILDLKNARWSEAEGTDAEWVADIDAAISKATGAS